MFKKKLSKKECLRQHKFLSMLQPCSSQRKTTLGRAVSGSKESHGSPRSQNQKKKKIVISHKLDPSSKPKDFRAARAPHLRCQSVDLMSQYEKILKMTKKFERTDHKRNCETPEIAVKSAKSKMQLGSMHHYFQEDERPYFSQQFESSTEKQQPTVIVDDLMCDEELDMTRPFPVLRTPQRDPVVPSSLSRYGLSNDLSVVEQRIISEEEKEFVSDKKKKVHMRMPTLSTAEKILCSANTATTIREQERHHRSTSPFEVGHSKPKKGLKISINVHALVAKGKKPKK